MSLYEKTKNQVTYWKKPEDIYEVPPTWDDWVKKDEFAMHFARDMHVEFTLAVQNHSFLGEYNNVVNSIRFMCALGEEEDAITNLVDVRDMINRRIEKEFNKEKELQEKDYKKWLVSIVDGFLAKKDIETTAYFSYCSMDHTSAVRLNGCINLENCHLSTKIGLRNTAIYLFCYDKSNLAETFLNAEAPDKRKYLYALQTFMKLNKQAMMNDKDAPIHRVRVEYDGMHIRNLVGDIVEIKIFLGKLKETKHEAKKQKMNQQ